MAIARPLAYCPTCKIAFPIAPRLERGTLVFQNSTTNCPNGHFARILNAHYQTFESEVQATLGIHGQGSHKSILALWDRLHRREIAPEQAQADAESIKSGLGSIFNAANFTDPTRKAILEALITVFVAGSEHDEEPSIIRQNVAIDAPPTPEAEAPQEMRESRTGGNRALQRSLRHKQRVLMNPRAR
jgi:hypothetical protein